MPQTRVLLIGIDEHDDCRIPALRGCRRDVGRWLGVLFPLVGFPEEQYRVLLSGPPPLAAELHQGRALRTHQVQSLIDAGCFGTATTKEILAGFEWLVQGAEKGERAVLVYAGYGTVIPAKGGGRRRAIVPQDAVLDVVKEVIRPEKTDREEGPAALPKARTGGPLRPSRGPLRPRPDGARLVHHPTRIQGAIPLPELDHAGRLVPAGHALDRAADPDKPAWAQLTAVLDTSFEPLQTDVLLSVRSLPVDAPTGPCLPVYALSSRTIVAARPGHHAHELGPQGAFSAAVAPTLQSWLRGQDAQGTAYLRMSHQQLVARAAESMRAQGLVQQPTLTGHRGVALGSFLCPALDCSCVDEVLQYVPPPEVQVHAGNNGVRVYELRFQATDAAGVPQWRSLGWVASVGETVSAAFQPQVNTTQTPAHSSGLGQLAARSMAAPGVQAAPGAQGGPGAQGAAAYPRNYQADREYWRLHDSAVVALFDAHNQGRLLSLELRAVRDHAWNAGPVANQANAAWFHNSFEANTRKRHCATFPDWPGQSLTAASGPHSVLFQATLGGHLMVLQVERSPMQPAVVARLRWHHARFMGGNHPTFFGALTVGGPGVVMGVTGGQQPPPAGRSTWYTASSTMQKLSSDP